MERLPPYTASGSSPVPPPPDSSQAQSTYYQQATPFPAQRPNIIKGFLRFLLRRTMYLGVVIGRMLVPFKFALFITLPLLALVGVLTTSLLWERIAPTPAVAQVDSLPPAFEVESFLEGQRTYDAERMWNAFSASFKAQLMDHGVSADTLKEQVQTEQMQGRNYLRPVYVGGVSLKSGGAMYFYLITASEPSARSSSSASFVFTVDTKGKIIGVDID